MCDYHCARNNMTNSPTPRKRSSIIVLVAAFLLFIGIPLALNVRKAAEPCQAIDLWRQWSGCFQTLAINDVAIDALAVAPNNRHIAISGRTPNDQTAIRLVTFAGEPLWSITTPDWIDKLLFSPDGNFLASVGHEGPITIWNSQTGAVLQTLQSDHIYLSFSKDSQLLLANDQLWQIATGQLIDKIDTGAANKRGIFLPGWGVFDAQSPDGRWFAEIRDNSNRTANAPLQLRSTQNGKVVPLELTPMSDVQYLRFSPTNDYVMSEYQSFQAPDEGGNVIIWRVQDGGLHYKLHLRERFRDIAWSPDSTLFAIGNNDGYRSTVQLYKITK